MDSASRPSIDLDALTHLLALADSWTPLTLGVAAALGIADHLTEGPRSIQDLAGKTGAQPDPLFRMLRLLSSRGVFRLVDGQRVALTAPAQFLRSDHPMSLRDMLSPLPEFLLAWSRAVDAVRTGKTAHALRHTFCTHLAEAGVPLEVIAELAGHVDLRTTKLYVTVTDQRRHAAIHQAFDAPSYLLAGAGPAATLP